MSIIQTRNLRRRFGDVAAVDGLDLEVQRGEIYGFLGPNGAGKSTTINMLLGFVPPTGGSGTILDADIETQSLQIRQRTGVLPEDFGVYDRLTARKHVEFAVDTKNAADDPAQLLERVGLGDAIDRKSGGFSTGMTQRLALAMALAGEPELLILDEPSSGLDPNGAREMRQIVTEEVDRGATVFFSSHSMEQVEAICDRVGIMREGRLVAEDTIDGLKSGFSSPSKLRVGVDSVPDAVLQRLRGLESVIDARTDSRFIYIELEEEAPKAPVFSTIEDQGVTIGEIGTKTASLEDLFASITTGERSAENPVEVRQ
ncbi:ABC transporter ATP-binding protein [Halobacteria archaeon AArc-curdl1]|uniref:ABC transporter ATP-binding protein n=1 Tax=Natronosalvus hydrolyticus TaxID=2979988 RepID=A0AAP2Z6Y2_9EURY|nr:ABC transporter ATP-binding protein [Halobacteria archaeon AArc-curdl1]